MDKKLFVRASARERVGLQQHVTAETAFDRVECAKHNEAYQEEPSVRTKSASVTSGDTVLPVLERER
jgi:hypothetical protein